MESPGHRDVVRRSEDDKAFCAHGHDIEKRRYRRLISHIDRSQFEEATVSRVQPAPTVADLARPIELSTAERVGASRSSAARDRAPRSSPDRGIGGRRGQAVDPRPVPPCLIGLAMVGGLLLGRWVPGLDAFLSSVEVDGVSLPIALGLLVMMYPVLAKVRYDRLDLVTGD